MVTKGDYQTYPATSNCGLQEWKIISWGKVWGSTSNCGSLLWENQILGQLKNQQIEQQFYFFLLECKSAALGQIWNAFGTPEMMCLMLSKLPGNTREKWIRNVMNIWESQILDDDATFANDPLFSKVALGGYVDKKEAPNQKKAAEEKTGTGKCLSIVSEEPWFR